MVFKKVIYGDDLISYSQFVNYIWRLLLNEYNVKSGALGLSL